MMLFKRNRLKAEIERLEAERDKIATDNNEMTARYDMLLHKTDEAQQRYNELTGAINVIETRDDYCIPYYADSLDVLEHKRHGMQAAIDAEIRNGLYSIKQQYRVDGSEAKGREMQKAMGEFETLAEFLRYWADNIYVDDGDGGYPLEDVLDDVAAWFNDTMTYDEAAEIVRAAKTWEEDE